MTRLAPWSSRYCRGLRPRPAERSSSGPHPGNGLVLPVSESRSAVWRLCWRPCSPRSSPRAPARRSRRPGSRSFPPRWRRRRRRPPPVRGSPPAPGRSHRHRAARARWRPRRRSGGPGPFAEGVRLEAAGDLAGAAAAFDRAAAADRTWPGPASTPACCASGWATTSRRGGLRAGHRGAAPTSRRPPRTWPASGSGRASSAEAEAGRCARAWPRPTAWRSGSGSPRCCWPAGKLDERRGRVPRPPSRRTRRTCGAMVVLATTYAPQEALRAGPDGARERPPGRPRRPGHLEPARLRGAGAGQPRPGHRALPDRGRAPPRLPRGPRQLRRHAGRRRRLRRRRPGAGAGGEVRPPLGRRLARSGQRLPRPAASSRRPRPPTRRRWSSTRRSTT